MSGAPSEPWNVLPILGWNARGFLSKHVFIDLDLQVHIICTHYVCNVSSVYSGGCVTGVHSRNCIEMY